MELSEQTARLSILINTALVLIKSVLALVSGSLAIGADAVHSLTDVISSAAVLIGIKLSRRRAKGFPYGLYKLENLVALGTSLLIFLAGYEILGEVFSASRVSPKHIPLAVTGTALTILITWKFSRYEQKKGEETGSPSLMADARHVWTDMLSSVVILVSLLGSAIGLPLDRFAALVVVFFIGKAAYEIFLDAVRVLLDASLDHDSLDKIRRIVLAHPLATEINELRARNAGRYKFVELDLTLRIKDLEKGHRVAEEIKNRVKTGVENVDHVLIHYEPLKKDHLVLAVPLKEDRRTIAEYFGEAAFFRLVSLSPESGTVASDALLRTPVTGKTRGKGIRVATWLLEQGLDVMIVSRELSGKGPGYVLGNADVEILTVSETDVDTALAAIRPELAKSLASSPHQAFIGCETRPH